MGCPTAARRGTCGATTASSCPSPRFRTGWSPRGGKGGERAERDYLDWALTGFSGYVAADELYDGPFCVLSIVDNRTFRRLVFDVLDHSPTKEDIERFFRRFWSLLLRRGLTVRGITTDGSPLYPEPIVAVFGPVPHQICEFHVIKDITLAVLRTVARQRKDIAAQIPPMSRGTHTRHALQPLARRRGELQRRITELFEHRHLFVRRELTAEQRSTLRRITRGQPALRRLREIVDEVYRLFDRRCRLEAALARLARLRRRAGRSKLLRKALARLFSPAMSKALTFLDDRLLPSTSNAVERGNRRHRKMQKSTYRVRTRQNLVGRLALDLLRDQRMQARSEAIETLHRQRRRTTRPARRTAAGAASRVREQPAA